MKTRLVAFGAVVVLLISTLACQSLDRTDPTRTGDAAISAQLHERIQQEFPGTALPVGIEVDDGHVIISGVVDSAEQRRMISEIAWDIAGVRRVSNNLGVRPRP